jgi:protein-serine/threonine kinase
MMAANDLACLIFGVSKAELKKVGILEVVREDKREWLEAKLNAARQSSLPVSPKPKSASPLPSSSPLGNGRTAKLLSKPPSRDTARWRRSQSDQPLRPNRDVTPEPETPEIVETPRKPRGVLICGDVISIKKRNGAFGSAALWVQEKAGALIWVMEEIAEDIAYITVDEVGCVVKSVGQAEAIWAMERLRRGMDVKRLLPSIPKLVKTNTGALDYDKIAEVRRYTARTANDINVPVTVDVVPGESTFMVSSFPNIAGMMVVSASTLRITSSNGPISEALFGLRPNGLPVTEIIPDFDKMLENLVEEDGVQIVEGMVVPEQNFRRARSNLAIREGKPGAAALFLRPCSLPAIHRDGSRIMIDVQMRVVKNDALGQSMDDSIAEEVATRPDFYHYKPKNLVYALWVTYSRLHQAMSTGNGVFSPAITRPPSPQPQPKPDAKIVQRHIEESSESDEEVREPRRPDTAISIASVRTVESLDLPSPIPPTTPGGSLPPKKAISDFIILEDMGAGAYGQVKLARQKSADGSPYGSPAPPGSEAAAMRVHHSPVVIKYVTKARILVDTWTRDRRLGTVPLEIHVLDSLRRNNYHHPNIVEMSDFFEDKINYYIEMIPHGLGGGMDLFDYIELKVNMDENECRAIFTQVASAIEFLHTKCKVVHRDIKDENVILDSEGRVKVIDFGSANYIKNGPFDVFVGTIGMSSTPQSA